MDRRSFLKRMAGAIVATVAAVYCPSLTEIVVADSPKTKEQIIADALECPEKRKALAMAMVEPIRRSLEYQAVGRKLFLVSSAMPLNRRS